MSILIIIGILIVDRLTKQWAMRLPRGTNLIPNVASARFVMNKGVAFSMLNRVPWLAVALSALMLMIALIILLKWRPRGLMRVSLSMVVAGGIGNLADRVMYHGVIDFISLDFIRFPVFNVADMAVTVGVLLAVIAVLISKDDGLWNSKST